MEIFQLNQFIVSKLFARTSLISSIVTELLLHPESFVDIPQPASS